MLADKYNLKYNINKNSRKKEVVSNVFVPTENLINF